MIKKILLSLAIIMIVNICAANLYVWLVWNSFPEMGLLISDLISLVLGCFLLKRNNLCGAIVLILFACVSLNMVYEIDGTFFSMGLLKYGPQVGR